MTMAISKAVEEGAKAVVCASTGNTSASAAAYAARAGLACVVLIPEGHIALGKLAQALVHGARVLQVRGNFDQLLTIVRDLPDHAPDHRGQLGQPAPDRGPEDRRLRDRRRARRRARRALHPGGQRREYLGLLAGLSPVQGGGAVDQVAADARLPGRRGGAHRARPPGRGARDHRHGHPHRQPGQLVLGHGRRRPSPAAPSRRSPTTRSWPPTPSWPSRSRCSARRPRRRRWPG